MMYLMAIDEGTSSTRAMIFDKESRVVGTAQRAIQLYYPNSGWVEQDGEEIWENTLAVMKEALYNARLEPSAIKGIGLTNQRETTLLWDAQTGKLLYHGIVWQDRRTQEYCLSLRQSQAETIINRKTGLLIDPYFSATKIHWILENIPEAKSLLQQGNLRFGTVETFLLWRLTGGKVHKTDVTNASRTSLLNIHTLQWDEELLALFQIPSSILPEVCENAGDFGATEESLLGASIPIVAMMGDQQAAAFGQTCFKAGMLKSTYGTGCFMLLNTGEEAIVSKHRLLTTIAYQHEGRVSYALEGSIFVAGAAVQWLRDAMKCITHSAETENLASQLQDNGGVYLVPAFTGLGAPYWNPEARGALVGLTRNTGLEHMVRATLESVCYQSQDLLLAMKGDGAEITELRVDGGMVVNDWLMQFLANIIHKPVERCSIMETSAQGVAYLAGLQVGLYPSLEYLSTLWHSEKVFEPRMESSTAEILYKGWCKAVNAINILS